MTKRFPQYLPWSVRWLSFGGKTEKSYYKSMKKERQEDHTNIRLIIYCLAVYQSTLILSLDYTSAVPNRYG